MRDDKPLSAAEQRELARLRASMPPEVVEACGAAVDFTEALNQITDDSLRYRLMYSLVRALVAEIDPKGMARASQMAAELPETWRDLFRP